MSPKRQMVVIMTDTQRTDMVGCYGNPAMRTPALDGLAAAGVRFERAYTCSPVCGPARAALFTGLWPHAAGSWANEMPLGANVRHVGQRLQALGLRAAYIGKWHLDGSDYFGLGVCPSGWDPEYWYDMRNYLDELSPEDRERSRRFETCLEPGFQADFTYAHRCSTRAERFLERCAGEDFLLVVSYDEPHHPFLCPAPFHTMYDDYDHPKSANVWDSLADKPAHHRDWAGSNLGVDKDRLRIRKSRAFGCNAFVDSQIGRVLAAVDRHAPEALVIYTADHGDMLWSHSLEQKGPSMYEEITRIPLIVRWPGRLPAGAVCDGLVSHIDLAPTLVGAAGADAPPAFEGHSLVDAVLQPESRREAVFIEYGRFGSDHDGHGDFEPIRAIRDERHKLVINLLDADEFYDLRADPHEMTNCIARAEYAAERDRLHDRLIEWMYRTRDPFRGWHWEARPWRPASPGSRWRHDTRPRPIEPGERPLLDYATGRIHGGPAR